ncbi:MAG: hypothetical protein EXS64_20285 [Candidatus Latescibacteria bacterium]|nr:hypothetical protein [Candidatus Latescibacterota bacterium]
MQTGKRSSVTIAILAVGIALVAGTMAFYEVRQTRREVLRILEQEASSLIESIAIAGEGAIRSYGEIESLVAERLLGSGRLLRRLDDRGLLSDDLLALVAKENQIHWIDVFDRDGERVYRATRARATRAFHPAPPRRCSTFCATRTRPSSDFWAKASKLTAGSRWLSAVPGGGPSC